MFDQYTSTGLGLLRTSDPDLYQALTDEHRRQEGHLVMVASCSLTDPSVLACLASVATNVTAEGYPGARYHAGCEHVDTIEQLAIDRAKQAFSAQYANVQAHSATTANYVVLSALLRPGDTLLGMELDYGGHLTHGSKVSYSGSYFRSIGYGLTAEGLIDYQQVERLAQEHRPKLIICGATAYSRTIDFARFRTIADSVGALVMADISHIAGLVVAGLHPNPIDHAHITTTCTHKQLAGPRGGLIMCGRDANTPHGDGRRTLAQTLQRAIFPYFQGAPIMSAIAAKARALAIAQTSAFRSMAQRILANASALAKHFAELGYEIVAGKTENHIVLLDLTKLGVSGRVAQGALERCGIIVNKNRIPGDQRPALIASGVRLGSNTLAQRGLGPEEMLQCARLVDTVLRAVRPRGDLEYDIEELTVERVRSEVQHLMARFPLSPREKEPALPSV